MKKFRTGEPCNHPGCMAHVSHPCEVCGRLQAGLKEIDMKYVKIPQSELDKLEEARQTLYVLLEQTEYIGNLSFGITDVMYRIANTKWEVIEEPCPYCRGRGYLLAPDGVPDKCKYCHGTGLKTNE